MSPLDDISTYQKIAEAASARGNPLQGPGPAMQPPPPGPQGSVNPEAIMGALQQIQPPLAPEQIKGVIQVFMQLTAGEEQGEPMPQGGPPPMM